MSMLPAMTHTVIAIDGPAASGKGTLAKRLAAHLGYAYLDTGLLYRLTALRTLSAAKNPDDEEDATSVSLSISSNIKPEDLEDPALRTDIVGQTASKVAKHPAVRSALLQFQKNFAATPPRGFTGVVMDGRDIGTVVCPNADVKLFVTASTTVRASRRFKELTAKGIETTQNAVLEEMVERDRRDSDRDVAPLKPAPDAHILDTSLMDADAAFDKALFLIQNR